jgi:hypothetical protein
MPQVPEISRIWQPEMLNQLLVAQVKELQEAIQKMAQDMTPSVASTEIGDSDDDFDDENQDDNEVSQDKKQSAIWNMKSSNCRCR